jgi:predicted nucleotidyltransferase component of viral defense system
LSDRDPRAFRASLDARLLNRSRETGLDVNRLRRHLVFQRILARLALQERWVLKGGYALEIRLSVNARATKDLDLAIRDSAPDLRDELVEALSDGVVNDGFVFEIRQARQIAPTDPENGAWRFSVLARLAGKQFASVVVDVVGPSDDLHDAVDRLVVPAPVAMPGLEPVTIAAVDIPQHAAEKFHAMARRYSGDRPSTRVKDLVDLVLMLEAGLLPDPRLGQRIAAVYATRNNSAPVDLPDPPSAWRDEFAALARDLDVTTNDVDEAMSLVRGLYRDATLS